jgi:WD40 repeat protein
MPGGFEDEDRKSQFSIPIFSPDSKTIAAFGNDNTVQFFNAETGRLIGKKSSAYKAK